MISWIRALVPRLLHISLLWKILLFNCVTTALLALVGAVLAVQHVQSSPPDLHYDLVALFLAASIVISFVVDLLLLRLVLAPLDDLETAVDSAAHGRRQTVAPRLMGDERLDRLAATISDMQKTLGDNAQRIHLLSQQVVNAQETERQRIARALHDEVAQTLTSVLLYLKLLEKSCTHEEAERLQNLRKLITHALSDIRQLAVELHPRVLDDWGLEAALGQRVDELNADGCRRVTLRVAGRSQERLPRDVELTFYHVAQEALSNVVHHAQARSAQVSLKQDADSLTLEVQDDGIGFNPDIVWTGRADGFGLSSMRERLALVGGELKIESEPGCGTRVRVRAPIPINPP